MTQHTALSVGPEEDRDPPDDMKEEALAESREAPPEEPETLKSVIEKASALKLEIEELEETVRLRKKALTQICTSTLPPLMQGIGVKSLTIPVGNREVDVSLVYNFRGSLNKAPDIEEAIDYLTEHGFGSGIKTVATVDFEQDMGEEERDALQGFVEDEFGKSVHLARTIHPSTLASFVREATAQHPSFDPAKVGITVMREATLKIK